SRGRPRGVACRARTDRSPSGWSRGGSRTASRQAARPPRCRRPDQDPRLVGPQVSRRGTSLRTVGGGFSGRGQRPHPILDGTTGRRSVPAGAGGGARRTGPARIPRRRDRGQGGCQELLGGVKPLPGVERNGAFAARRAADGNTVSDGPVVARQQAQPRLLWGFPGTAGAYRAGGSRGAEHPVREQAARTDGGNAVRSE